MRVELHLTDACVMQASHWIMDSLSIYFKFFLLSALGIIQVKTEIFRNGCRRDGKFKLVERNVRLDVDVASTIVAQSLSICAKACVDNIVCNSFNYNTNSKLCEVLLETRSMVGDSKLITASSWKHYEPVKQVHPFEYYNKHNYKMIIAWHIQKSYSNTNKDEVLCIFSEILQLNAFIFPIRVLTSFTNLNFIK